jgi:carbamoylphosphate synthase large subunit
MKKLVLAVTLVCASIGAHAETTEVPTYASQEQGQACQDLQETKDHLAKYGTPSPVYTASRIANLTAKCNGDANPPPVVIRPNMHLMLCGTFAHETGEQQQERIRSASPAQLRELKQCLEGR